jgi:hypothetical protein
MHFLKCVDSVRLSRGACGSMRLGFEGRWRALRPQKDHFGSNGVLRHVPGHGMVAGAHAANHFPHASQLRPAAWGLKSLLKHSHACGSEELTPPFSPSLPHAHLHTPLFQPPSCSLSPSRMHAPPPPPPWTSRSSSAMSYSSGGAGYGSSRLAQPSAGTPANYSSSPTSSYGGAATSAASGRTGGYTGAASAGGAGSYGSTQQQQQQSPWVLEPIQNGQYLLDRSTGMVYSNALAQGGPGGSQQFLQLVGQYQNQQLVMRARNNAGDLFKALDSLLKTQQVCSMRACACVCVCVCTCTCARVCVYVCVCVREREREREGRLFLTCTSGLSAVHTQVRFQDLFDRYDTDRSGTLEMDELRVLVQKLLPDVKEQELRYFQVRACVREKEEEERFYSPFGDNGAYCTQGDCLLD